MRRRLIGLGVVMLVTFPAGSAYAETFSVLTYNVRGLPSQVIEDRTAQIAAIAVLLEDYHTSGGDYDGIAAIVQLQELFDQGYYNTITDDQTVTYPFITTKSTAGQFGLGDGLNDLSDFAFSGFTRTQWDSCFGTQGNDGSDCDTPKGFSFGTFELEPGVTVDVYNLHADAGQDDGSRAARRDNISQIIEAINTNSPAGTAVIVTGDTNSHYTRTPNDNIETLLSGTGVTDVWVEFVNGGDVPGAGADIESGCDSDPSGADCELIDKVFYRSGTDVTLTPTSYAALKTLFSDDGGNDLSDHIPVSVVFEYTVNGSSTTTPSTTTTTVIGGTTTTVPVTTTTVPGGTTTTISVTTTTVTGGTTTTVPATTTTVAGGTTTTITVTTTTVGGGTTTTVPGGTTTTVPGGTTTTVTLPGSTTTTVPGGTTTTVPGGTTTLPGGTTTTVPGGTTTTVPGGTTTTLVSTTTTTTLPPDNCGDPQSLVGEVIGGGPRDANITAADALLVLRAAVGSVSCELCRCDVDDNGGITAGDALRVLRRAVGQLVTLTCPACS